MRARPYLAAVVVAAVSGLAAVVMAVAVGLPLRDPDGMAGPSYVRLPLVLGFFFLVDVVPRAVKRAPSAGAFLGSLRDVFRDRWPWRRVRLAVVGLLSFYVTYVAYRNLKGYLPSAREDLFDDWLAVADRILFLGYDPAVVLHNVLGTGAAAYVLSFVYVSYLVVVPLSLAAALVWTRDLARGFWYVAALNLNWALGVASYYVAPSLGPIYVEPENFANLPETGVSMLQDSLWNTRITVLMEPGATDSVHGVAAFGSLHVSVVFTAAYFAHRIGLHGALCAILWVYLGLTVLSTVYFGWHYVVDDVAGIAIGWASVTVAAIATGHGDDGRRLRDRFRNRAREHERIEPTDRSPHAADR
jgi:hypothetical protein